MWASQRADETVGRGAGNAASTLLAYDTPHAIPWGVDVALYLWTKSIAAGALLVPALGILLGYFGASTLASVWAPLFAILFLAVTTFLLVVDLEHPAKFYTILTRPQWKSWLVRGAIALMGYGAVAALWLLPVILGAEYFPARFLWGLSWLAVPLAAAAAGYTAFLFAQATGRELWATPLAAPHLVVQALLAGSAIHLMLGAALGAPGPYVASTDDVAWIRAIFAFCLLGHALFVAAEIFSPHRSTHVSRAVETIVKGKYKREFWIAVVAIGILAAFVAILASNLAIAWSLGAALALFGLYVWEYVWVFAGQSVPLS
jgi:Ni/Fe-hydrogenase subunit HybB-like protein